MSSVLGVSVGASAVRLMSRGQGVNSLTVDAALDPPEDLAAESIGTLLAERVGEERVQTIGIAYQDEAQAGAVRAALACQQIDNYRLVPEVIAALGKLDVSGELGGYSTLLFYDLGSSGLTVTVVDRSTRMVLSAARTDEISGDLIDHLIRDRQLALHHIDRPADQAAERALDTQCREAKEGLSTGGTVCMPGDGGLLVLSLDTLDSLIEGAVEKSMRLARKVIGRSGRTPHVAVLIGGGAHIPLVTSVMESLLDLPVIVPDQPELVAAEGAALLAESVSDPTPRTLADDSSVPPIAETTTKPWRKGRVLIGGGLAVLVVVGLGLGVGVKLSSGSQDSPQVGVTQPDTSPPIAVVQSPAVPPAAEQPQVLSPPGPLPPETAPAATARPSPSAQSVAPTTGEAEGPAAQDSIPGPPEEDAQVPPPEQEPAPGPLIPGLPVIPLPVIPLPAIQLPQFPPPPELPLVPGP
ncbi:Hsp70 family protein [Rhodococcus marinonascens]|uniref:Hsp70 family protein n=1 Tax=Rhodococcus marinonascens TaxID=38311 RepID=UPI000AFC30EB|nr:Hsp70 family protein [Rhodococcus marinonascens]